jgi:hypothetical protein
MELDLQSLFGLYEYICTHWLSPRTPPPHISPHWDSYTRVLLVSKDRRHLFVTPCFSQIQSTSYGYFTCCGSLFYRCRHRSPTVKEIWKNEQVAYLPFYLSIYISIFILSMIYICLMVLWRSFHAVWSCLQLGAGARVCRALEKESATRTSPPPSPPPLPPPPAPPPRPVLISSWQKEILFMSVILQGEWKLQGNVTKKLFP